MKKVKCVTGLLVAGLLIAGGITGVRAESIKVGIYRSDARKKYKGMYESLRAEKEIRVNFILSLDRAALSGIDVLIIPQVRDAGEIKEKIEQIRSWVKDGHGLMVIHDAVGYRKHPAIFPEIAIGIGHPYNKQTGYGKECIVVRSHPITEGLKIKEVVEHSYFDQIQIEAGEKAEVIAREAIILDKSNVITGEAVIVAGKIGEGRYVANGLAIGYNESGNEVVPKGKELRLFINSIKWLAFKSKYSYGKEIGDGVKIARAEKRERIVKKKVIDYEKILADSIEHFQADWQKSRIKKMPKVIESNFKEPIKFDEKVMEGSGYSSIPDGWREIDLSGVWKINKLKGTEKNPSDDEGTVKGYYKADYDDKEWKVRSVPSSWDNKDYKDAEDIIRQLNLTTEDGVGFSNFTGVGWYRRKVYIPEEHKGRRIVLHFERCDYETRAWINGRYIDRHTGGRTPFEFDITDTVKYGRKNTIAIRVYDIDRQTPYGYQMYGDDDVKYGRLLGGLYGEVYLSIRPDVYAVRTLITPHLAVSEIEIDCWLNNTGKAKEVRLNAKVIPCPPPLAKGRGRKTEVNLGKVKLLSGINKYNFRVKLKEPIFWETDNPYLYVLKLTEGKETLTKQRFGFREFKADGAYFRLNEKRVYLRSGNVIRNAFYMKPRIVLKDEAKFMTRYLLGIKSFNCNMIYDWYYDHPRKLYDLCDELGLLVYHEWVVASCYFHNPLMEEGWNKGETEIEVWLYETYSNPCIAVYSLGAELFEAKNTPKPYKSYDELLNPTYEIMKRADKQNRPVCQSSGRDTWKQPKSKTDIHDYHFYPGGIAASWTDETKGIKEHVWKYAAWIHKVEKPVIQFECGPARHYNPDLAALKRLFEEEKSTDKMNRKKFISLLQKKPPNYVGTRWISNMYGVRRHLDDIGGEQGFRCGAGRQIHGRKNVGEEMRRLGPLLQAHNAADTHAFDITEVMENDKLFPGRADGKGRISGDLSKKIYVEGEAYQAFKRVNNPKFICLDVFDKNVFAGRKLSFNIYAINDIDELSRDWLVRVVIKDKEGNILEDKSVDIGRVKGFKRKLMPYTYSVPSRLKTGFYRIELFLYEGKEIVSDNWYEFFVLGKKDNLTKIETASRIALYDARNRLYKEGIQTKDIMEGLKIRYNPIKNFNDLEKYNVLIIGADSIDTVVKNSGDKIRKWIENGGKLLQFDQHVPGAVPYWRKLRLLSGKTHILTEIIELNHPIFKGLSYLNMERWSNLSGSRTPGEVFRLTLSPLDESALAVGSICPPRNSTKSTKMTMSEVEIGKGRLLMIQAEATQRYNKDSVATKLIQNVLEYILGE